MAVIQSTILLPGQAQGRLLRLSADISFWGGVDPASGDIIDRRHPQFGECVTGSILAMQRSIGSSSGSSILLELFRRDLGPAGIILAEADFVIVLGAVVAREMEFPPVPVLQIPHAAMAALPPYVSINLQGEISPAEG